MGQLMITFSAGLLVGRPSRLPAKNASRRQPGRSPCKSVASLQTERRFPALPAAFTLIELLVSMTVLVIVILAVTQIVNSTNSITTGSRKHMDADGQARAVFDRLGQDLAGMLLREDVDYVFAKNAGNDKMFFYSEAPGYFSGNPAPQARASVSLVGYRVNPNLTPAFQLERLGKGLTWDGAASAERGGSVIFLTFPSPAPSPASTVPPDPVPESTLAKNWSATLGAPTGFDDGVDEDYHELASGVFRLEYCFKLKNGMISAQPFSAPHRAPEGMKFVSAIIVAIAVLDDASRKTVSRTDQMVPALEDFTGIDQPADTDLMATRWQNAVNAKSFAQASGLPHSAAAGVRIYQRSFPLNAK